MARKQVGKTFEGVTGLRRVVVAFVLFVFLLLVAAFIFFFIRAWPTMNPKLPFPLRVLMASVRLAKAACRFGDMVCRQPRIGKLEAR
jgi:hypothetical protein